MRVAATVLAAVFMTLLLSAVMPGPSRQVSFLKSRLDDSEAEIRELHAEIERLRREESESRERLNAELASRFVQYEKSARAEHLGIMRTITPDVTALYRDVLHPSVQVTGLGGVGGGTLLYSKRGRTYVITAYHVVPKPADGEGHGIQVKLYNERGMPEETVEGVLVASDERKDLALLRISSDRTCPNVARLASREALRSIKVFTPVYAVGCPLGHDPLPTLGEVATLNKEVGSERFWMTNAPTIFGNSGGGIFHRETREMIGVSVMICTYDGVISTPVPHLGILVSLDVVYDWLDSLGYRFIYDPDEEPETCMTDRDRDSADAESPPADPRDMAAQPDR